MEIRFIGTLDELMDSVDALEWDGTLMIRRGDPIDMPSQCIVLPIDALDDDEITVDGVEYVDIIDVQQLQSIIRNARSQAVQTRKGLLCALQYYIDNDAFIDVDEGRENGKASG